MHTVIATQHGPAVERADQGEHRLLLRPHVPDDADLEPPKVGAAVALHGPKSGHIHSTHIFMRVCASAAWHGHAR